MELISKNAMKKEMRIHFIFGDVDRVISSNIGKAALKKFSMNADLFLLSGGHHLLVTTNLAALINRYALK
jgi:hypothetical protein